MNRAGRIGRLWRWMRRHGRWAGAALVLLVGLAVILPLHDEVDQAQRKQRWLGMELARLQQQEERLPQLRARLADTRQRLAVLQVRFPEQLDARAHADWLLQTARDSGARMQQFLPQPVREREFYAEQQVALRLAGDFAQLRGFVERLQQGRIASWQRLDLAYEPQAGHWLLQGELVIFSYRPQ